MDFHVDDKVKVIKIIYGDEFLLNHIGFVVDIFDNKDILVDIYGQNDEDNGEFTFVQEELEKI
jgi:hypothetical protein